MPGRRVGLAGEAGHHGVGDMGRSGVGWEKLLSKEDIVPLSTDRQLLLSRELHAKRTDTDHRPKHSTVSGHGSHCGNRDLLHHALWADDILHSRVAEFGLFKPLLGETDVVSLLIWAKWWIW
jgi:hypothetical protein